MNRSFQPLLGLSATTEGHGSAGSPSTPGTLLSSLPDTSSTVSPHRMVQFASSTLGTPSQGPRSQGDASGSLTRDSTLLGVSDTTASGERYVSMDVSSLSREAVGTST